MKRCGQCNSLMPDDVTRCIRCGFDPLRDLQPVKKGRIANGFALAGQSWRVLMLDKTLLVFPLLSGIACFLVLASFAGVGFATGMHVKDPEHLDAVHWIVLFLYYFANYFVIVYFNVALVACAMIRFRGGKPTLRDGLAAARERIG